MKVYALCYKTPKSLSEKYELKITAEKQWENQAPMIKASGEPIVQYNDNYYLSFSRATLVEKAKEIQFDWIALEKQRILEIEAIEIK